MSHVISNLRYEGKPFELTEDEVKRMSVAEFDKLLLSDQIGIFHNYPDQYNRLTGRTEDDRSAVCADDKSDASANVDEYERRVDQILQKYFHPNEA